MKRTRFGQLWKRRESSLHLPQDREAGRTDENQDADLEPAWQKGKVDKTLLEEEEDEPDRSLDKLRGRSVPLLLDRLEVYLVIEHDRRREAAQLAWDGGLDVGIGIAF